MSNEHVSDPAMPKRSASDYCPYPPREDMQCQGCGSVEQCATHAGKELCYDCWHAAREKEQPWMIVLPWNHDFQCNGVRQLEHEAKEFAAESPESRLAVPAPSWSGERIAHPGYLHRRRAQLISRLT